MRTFKFDRFELDPPDAEQEIEVIISSPQDARHPTIQKFADDICGEGAGRRLLEPIAFSKSPSFAERSTHLKRVAAIDVSPDCAWPCYVISDEWDDQQIVLDAGHTFISYRWSTTA